MIIKSYQILPLRIEWQTVLLGVLIYVLFGFVTWNYHSLPSWLVFTVGGYVVAWHGSLRHEAVHLHPTSSAHINELFVLPSLDLYLPFRLYKQNHTVHHIDVNLTYPEQDPESFYLFHRNWETLPQWRKKGYWVFHTLAGRLFLYPFWMISCFLKDEAQRFIRGDQRNLSAWLWHFFGVMLTLSWVSGVCGIPFLEYLFLFAFPGTSLTLLRSFAEHRSHPEFEGRTAILEAEFLFGILYLYNNYHALHHYYPDLAWYKLSAKFLQERKFLLLHNHGYLIRGYRELVSNYLLKPKEIPYFM
ncbi:MAG: fatty acid desaturase [SAR324 cluster bacterium]|nr:fatty acid desaturase [SAR324 cluster bacterium]MBL7035312.1 fatty acid desaturase [SAR324 cluster bacterium]